MGSMSKSAPSLSPTASTVLGSDGDHADLHLSIESSTTTVSASSSTTAKTTATTPHADKKFTRSEWRDRIRSIRPVEVTWMVLYACANGAVFAQKANQYAHDSDARAVYGRCVVAARGAAACINLNCLLILLPVCRHLIATLRASTTIQRVVPVDRHLKAHVMIGTAILVFTVIHVGGQVCNAYQFSRAEEADIHALFGSKMATVPSESRSRWTSAFTSLPGWTGVVLTALMLVAYPLTLVRRKRYNLFWSSHQLLLLMLVIMCVHGTASMLEPYRSLAWTIGPLSIYALFRVMREVPSLTRASLLSANLLPGGVVHLRLSKPRAWGGTHVHKPGMMGMVKIPQLSVLEWHPFSLTSLPSDEHLEFHMKVSGDWTTRLHERLAAANTPSSSPLEAGRAEADPILADVESPPPPPEYFPRTNSPGLRNEVSPTVGSDLTFLIDGPMSSATQSYADHPAVVLIGSGIGITPAISVLRHVASAASHLPTSATKRVYFFWVVRNAECLGWFAHDLDRMISRQGRRRCRRGGGGTTIQTRIRCYVTGSNGGDSTTTFRGGSSSHLSPARSSDGTDTPHLNRVTRAGRPDWMDELNEVRADALSAGVDRCKVFICGSAPLVQEVSRCATSLGSGSFRYDVAYENFLMA